MTYLLSRMPPPALQAGQLQLHCQCRQLLDTRGVDRDDIRPLHDAITLRGMSFAWGSRLEQDALRLQPARVVFGRGRWRRPVLADAVAVDEDLWVAAAPVVSDRISHVSEVGVAYRVVR